MPRLKEGREEGGREGGRERRVGGRERREEGGKGREKEGVTKGAWSEVQRHSSHLIILHFMLCILVVASLVSMTD